MYSGDRTGLAQRGSRHYRVSGVQRKVPVREIFRRQRLFPLCVFSLFFDFEITQHGDQYDKNNTTQTAADYQAQSPREDGALVLFV